MEYEVKYSKRRSLSLVIRREGTLLVRAPYGFPDKKIRQAIEEHGEWITKHTEIAKRKNDRFSSLTEDDIQRLKKEAKSVLPEILSRYSKIMGLNYEKVTITSAKTRFGSCSASGNIALSWRLMCYPKEAQEYVVVHELAHRRYMDHSRDFYALIEQVLPDYKARKKLLKE